MIATFDVSMPLRLTYCRRHQRAWVASLEHGVTFPRSQHGPCMGALSRKLSVTPVRRVCSGSTRMGGHRVASWP